MAASRMTGRAGGYCLAVALSFSAVLAPAPASAQWGEILALQQGDSIRLRLPGALRVSASMWAMRQDTLVLHTGGLQGEWPISGYDLVSLEQYRNRTPQEGLRHGAVLGMAGGLFSGALLGVLFDVVAGDGEGEPSARLLGSSLKGAGLGAALGMVAGGVMGGRRPGRGWVALELPSR